MSTRLTSWEWYPGFEMPVVSFQPPWRKSKWDTTINCVLAPMSTPSYSYNLPVADLVWGCFSSLTLALLGPNFLTSNSNAEFEGEEVLQTGCGFGFTGLVPSQVSKGLLGRWQLSFILRLDVTFALNRMEEMEVPWKSFVEMIWLK